MSWVHDRIFAAGGSHIPETWGVFRTQTRINSIVHLNPDAPQRFEGPAPAGFLWLDLEVEREATRHARWLAGRFVRDRLEAGDSLLLHSGEGRHRTRWVFVSFLLLQGRTLDSALRQAEELPWLAPYETDRDVWEDFAAWLKAEPRAAG